MNKTFGRLFNFKSSQLNGKNKNTKSYSIPSNLTEIIKVKEENNTIIDFH